MTDIFLTYPISDKASFNSGSAPFVMISAYDISETDRHILAENIRSQKVQAGATIILPVPVTGWSTNEVHSYDTNTGMAGNAAQEATAKLADLAASIELGNAGSRLIGEAAAPNDMMSLLFKSTEMRTFSFSWSMSAASPIEEKAIGKIIQTLRFLSHGSNNGTGGKIAAAIASFGQSDKVGDTSFNNVRANPLIQSPAFWRVQIVYQNKILFSTDYCVIESVKVDKKGNDANFTLFADGGIPQYQLDVSFKELFKHTRESMILLEDSFNAESFQPTLEPQPAPGFVGGVEKYTAKAKNAIIGVFR